MTQRRKIAEVLIQSIKNYDNVQNTKAKEGHTLKMSALGVPAPRVPTLTQKQFATDYLLAKGKSAFSNGVSGYCNHTPGQTPCSQAAGQHKTNSALLGFGGDFVLFCHFLSCWGFCFDFHYLILFI